MNVELEIAQAQVALYRMADIEQFELIGSASYLPEQAEDIDFAVLLKTYGPEIHEFVHDRVAEGWHNCGGDYDTNGQEWCAIRKGKLNLMLTQSMDFFAGYLRATEVCKALNLTKKDDRILVCSIVRDRLSADAALARLAALKNKAKADKELEDEL